MHLGSVWFTGMILRRNEMAISLPPNGMTSEWWLHRKTYILSFSANKTSERAFNKNDHCIWASFQSTKNCLSNFLTGQDHFSPFFSPFGCPRQTLCVLIQTIPDPHGKCFSKRSVLRGSQQNEQQINLNNCQRLKLWDQFLCNSINELFCVQVELPGYPAYIEKHLKNNGW